MHFKSLILLGGGKVNMRHTYAFLTNILAIPHVRTECWSPPNGYVEALTPSATIFEDRTFMEVIRVKWCQKVGPYLRELLYLINKQRDQNSVPSCILTKERPREHTVRKRQPSRELPWKPTAVFQMHICRSVRICIQMNKKDLSSYVPFGHSL